MTLPRLYAIADASFGDPVRLAHSLFNSGIRLLQVRNKSASSRVLFDQVETIVRFAPPDAYVIVNDRADIARITGTGVHIGQQDLPSQAARRIVGPAAIVGLSTHNLEQALAADAEPVDYIAVGPVFQTRTKTNPDPELGVDQLRAICSRVGKPVVAIGGITRRNAAEVWSCGVASIAVISDLVGTENLDERARDWLRYTERGI